MKPFCKYEKFRLTKQTRFGKCANFIVHLKYNLMFCIVSLEIDFEGKSSSVTSVL